VDALDIKGFDFQRAAAELGKAESPVLGCMHKEGLLAHAKTQCLGFLSTEHLVFLLSFMDGGIQFNLTECRECENGLILDKLSDVIASVGRTVTGMAPRLRAIYEKDELEFQEISLSRRGFFRLLRGSTVEGVSCVAEELSRTEKSQPYGSKKIPGKRELLNRACRKLGTVDGDLLSNYFTVKVDDACNACSTCAAMCPNGALKCGREGETKALSFNASRCSGCGLCEEFCMHNAIVLGSGHDGIGLVEFVSVTTGSRVEVEQGNAA
jgi:Pyruvate/2-oxoacid:ferredoxin oxidoreductase delta subunit